MQKAELRAGERWAYRKSTGLEAPAQCVELLALAPMSRPLKVKVRYKEGQGLNPSLKGGEAVNLTFLPWATYVAFYEPHASRSPLLHR